MHFKEVKGILSTKNGMNIYRGCSHGCIYCDSRSKCYQMDHDFEDIEVKSNAIELLQQRLKQKRQKCMIVTGSMSDPYMHIENQLQMTRKSLEVIEEHGFGASILTKSDLVLRDIDIIQRIHEKSRFVLQMTLTTFDEDLCKIIEPNVASTKKRVEVLMKMKELGIPTVVWLCPILPFINDTKENLQGILDYCLDAGVKGILCFNMGVTLREGDREYFYQKLDQHFPGLKKKYEVCYGNNYEVSSPNNIQLMQLFHSFCQEHQILYRIEDIFSYIREFPKQDKFEQERLF